MRWIGAKSVCPAMTAKLKSETYRHICRARSRS